MKVSKKTEIAVNARYRHHTGRIYIVEGIYREEDLGVEFVAHRVNMMNAVGCALCLTSLVRKTVFSASHWPQVKSA